MRKTNDDIEERKLNYSNKNPFIGINNKKNISKPIMKKTLDLDDSKQFNLDNKNEITIGTDEFESSFEVIEEQPIPRASLPKSVVTKHVTSKPK